MMNILNWLLHFIGQHSFDVYDSNVVTQSFENQQWRVCVWCGKIEWNQNLPFDTIQCWRPYPSFVYIEYKLPFKNTI